MIMILINSASMKLAFVLRLINCIEGCLKNQNDIQEYFIHKTCTCNILFSPTVQCAIKTCYKDQYTWTFDKYCIEANDHTRDWNSARAYCRKRGGDLIEIRSREMQTSVEMNLKKKGHLNVAYWIGATDSDSETHWHWLNGKIILRALGTDSDSETHWHWLNGKIILRALGTDSDSETHWHWLNGKIILRALGTDSDSETHWHWLNGKIILRTLGLNRDLSQENTMY